jgi:hypothetical protein
MATTRWIPAKPEGSGYFRAAEGLLPVSGDVPRHLVKILISAFLDGQHIETISKAVMAALAKLPSDSDLYNAVVAMTDASSVFTTGDLQEDKLNHQWSVPFVAYVYDAAR